MNVKNRMKSAALILFLIIFASGCALPGLSGGAENSVKIGAMSTSETQILAHMIRIMVERDTNLNVEIVNNLGTSIVTHKAMESGDINLSAIRYTGTDLAGALGMEPEKDPKKAMEIVQKEFKERYNQVWYDSYGFANSYGFAVREDFAKKENLTKVSDLERIASDIRLGVDNSWLKRKGDGYEGFTDEYGFKFGTIYPMQIGLVYDALDTNKMDLALAYTTDGRIAAYNLKVLEDDKKFFPPYDASPVISADLLKEHPELGDILQRLVGKIDTNTMQKLNYEADGKLREPAVIAEEFLKQNNYFEN